jgi:hypothetical protein
LENTKNYYIKVASTCLVVVFSNTKPRQNNNIMLYPLFLAKPAILTVAACYFAGFGPLGFTLAVALIALA